MDYGLAAHARERPHKPALILGDRVLTYGELDAFEFVPSLPRDPNGKVLKRKLRDPYWRGRSRNI